MNSDRNLNPNSGNEHTITGTPPAARDEGSMLIIALVLMVVSALLILPMMDYASAIGRSGRVLQSKSVRVEAVKGGLRTSLADPIGLYKTCGYTDPQNPGAGLNRAVNLAPLTLGDVTVSSTCYLMDLGYSSTGPSAGRYAVAHVQTGSVTPAGMAAAEKVYPRSGQTPPNAWLSDTSTTPLTDKIWLPYLPAHGLNKRSVAGYSMPAGFPACKVYFPGTYLDDLVITGSTPVFFTSGIYYFEKQVRISGDAKVVVGGGAIDGCASDQEAAFYATGAPANHNISGLGTTFVFGLNGRLVIDTLTPGTETSVQFNQRYVAPNDVSTASSAGVSILTVNGQLTGSVAGALDLPGLLYVPLSMVGGTTPSAALAQEYKPSLLVPAALPPPPPSTTTTVGATTTTTISATTTTAAPAAVQTAVLEVNLTNAQKVTIDIPGYVSMPQGLLRVTTAGGAEANKTINIAGGVLASSIEVGGTPPAKWKLGLSNPVVQQTFKIVTQSNGSPRVVSTAIVQVNQNGAYAINSWAVQ